MAARSRKISVQLLPFGSGDQDLVNNHLGSKLDGTLESDCGILVPEHDIYEDDAGDLITKYNELSDMGSNGRECFFFCPRKKKGRQTPNGFWKSTSKLRFVEGADGSRYLKRYFSFSSGRQQGDNLLTEWAMHEFSNPSDESFILCHIKLKKKQNKRKPKKLNKKKGILKQSTKAPDSNLSLLLCTTPPQKQLVQTDDILSPPPNPSTDFMHPPRCYQVSAQCNAKESDNPTQHSTTSESSKVNEYSLQPQMNENQNTNLEASSEFSFQSPCPTNLPNSAQSTYFTRPPDMLDKTFSSIPSASVNANDNIVSCPRFDAWDQVSSDMPIGSAVHENNLEAYPMSTMEEPHISTNHYQDLYLPNNCGYSLEQPHIFVEEICPSSYNTFNNNICGPQMYMPIGLESYGPGEIDKEEWLQYIQDPLMHSLKQLNKPAEGIFSNVSNAISNLNKDGYGEAMLLDHDQDSIQTHFGSLNGLTDSGVQATNLSATPQPTVEPQISTFHSQDPTNYTQNQELPTLQELQMFMGGISSWPDGTSNSQASTGHFQDPTYRSEYPSYGPLETNPKDFVQSIQDSQELTHLSNLGFANGMPSGEAFLNGGNSFFKMNCHRCGALIPVVHDQDMIRVQVGSQNHGMRETNQEKSSPINIQFDASTQQLNFTLSNRITSSSQQFQVPMQGLSPFIGNILFSSNGCGYLNVTVTQHQSTSPEVDSPNQLSCSESCMSQTMEVPQSLANVFNSLDNGASLPLQPQIQMEERSPFANSTSTGVYSEEISLCPPSGTFEKDDHSSGAPQINQLMDMPCISDELTSNHIDRNYQCVWK